MIQIQRKEVKIIIISTVVLILFSMFSFGYIVGIHKNFESNQTVVQEVVDEVIEEPIKAPEIAELQVARYEYYKSQARYYNLMSIDYEDNLRSRGLIE